MDRLSSSTEQDHLQKTNLAITFALHTLQKHNTILGETKDLDQQEHDSHRIIIQRTKSPSHCKLNLKASIVMSRNGQNPVK